jgi:peptidoglycan/LPS O-acetylase OafA/YrhL
MEINRKSNNFDLLRLLFSLIVAIVHCAELSKVDFLSGVGRYLSSGVAVDSFFVISGFLIFMSYDSSKSLSSYASKRLRRIFPGYIAVIIICAIFLYAISSKSFFEYANTELFKYISFNALTLNFIHPTLPGVFEGNQIHAVNGALWTIKIEVMFYITVPFIAFLISKLNKALVLSIIYALSITYSFVLLWLYSNSGAEIYIKLERQLPGQLAFFISGAAVYYFYDLFHKNNTQLLTLSFLIICFHKYIIDIHVFYPISLAVIVLYFANIFKYLGNFGKFGDLSFGVYIWHFPILQVFVFYNLFVNPVIGVGLFLTTIIFASFLSWHLIEKRYLYKSSHYIILEQDSITKKSS